MTETLAVAAPPKVRVLLVEDDDTLAGLLARVLRTDGYQVDVLEPGRACRRARSSPATTSC